MTQGKAERWHQTPKNRILVNNYYLPGDLENQIEAFVADGYSNGNPLRVWNAEPWGGWAARATK